VSETKDPFERLVRPHARLIAGVIRRVCGRRHQALVEDVEQEVYLALWKRLAGGKEIEHPTSYLYKVALTTAVAVIRRRGIDWTSLDDPAVGDPPARPVAEMPEAERARLIGQLLERLEPDDARALRAYLAGFSHVEIARLYGWSESVARHRVYRTMERLRAEVGATKETPGGA
jgi:RNA polymerase sigma-70 factor (ECF subfamily)